MTTSPLTPQSLVARRAAEAQLRELVVRFAPAQEKLVAAVRRWLRKRLPGAHELVYEYRDCFVISCSPNAHGYEGVFAIRGSKEGVRLYFNFAKGLPDPEKLLQGSGTQARWIPLEGTSTLARPAALGRRRHRPQSRPVRHHRPRPGDPAIHQDPADCGAPQNKVMIECIYE